MKHIAFVALVLVVSFNSLQSQVRISADVGTPDKSAMLDINSSSKGLLLPRMTTLQIGNIWSPTAGLVVYNIDSSDFYGFNGEEWVAFWDKTDTIERMCPDSIYYGGQWYNTVQVGTQCWMAENLNAGTQIPGLTYQQDNDIIEKHCYNDVSDSCAIYGGLYEWNEMMDYSVAEGAQGICPAGWHVPTLSQWNSLASFMGGSSVAGGHIKETGYRHWKSPNTAADNSSGFSAIGGGTYRPFFYNYYYLIREMGIYWTSTTPGYGQAIRQDLYSTTSDINQYTCEREHSFSVRCLKD